MNNQELQFIDMQKIDNLNKASARVHYESAKRFDENDAEATIQALVENYPGLVMKVLSQHYIKNLATLEAMNTFMKGWSGETMQYL